MEKSGVVEIMAEAHQKSRTMAAAYEGRGQTYRGYNANLVPFAVYFTKLCQTGKQLCNWALQVFVHRQRIRVRCS